MADPPCVQIHPCSDMTGKPHSDLRTVRWIKYHLVTSTAARNTEAFYMNSYKITTATFVRFLPH